MVTYKVSLICLGDIILQQLLKWLLLLKIKWCFKLLKLSCCLLLKLQPNIKESFDHMFGSFDIHFSTQLQQQG